ncbi:uncharacterized protein BCR38DRAFT_10867 [Pseudomassariella vexata]|uniref:Rhodopsin domain-containing protein n=1 Tax=Pseudomassariella vexata TaxID=1141098 RepID=A0A1Y2EIT7_9PEZI|nr:uncharacterized protein BCR38DRAFT_10867 [Pseudomassariella vexata]ORY71470.1 hypothetical protein BCR38DRAFT_10867 [Pseudomassariella vexata]
MPLASSPSADSDSLDARVISCAILTLVISAVVVALRFYTRCRIIHALGAEDWFILVAWVFALGSSIGTWKQAYWALGQHLDTVTPQELSFFLRAVWWTMILYIVSFTSTKISILLLYIRVLTSYENFRRGAWAMLILVTIGGASIFVTSMTACIPLNKYWDLDTEGYCHPTGVWWYNTGFLIGTDFLIFLLPMPVLIGLRMPMRQKWELLGVFAIGFFICLISIFRVIWLTQLAGSVDYTYDNTPLAEWTCVELNTAIVCASLVTLKPLYHKVFPPKQHLMLDGETAQRDHPMTIGGLRIRPLQEGHYVDMYDQSSRPMTGTRSPRSGSMGRNHDTASDDTLVGLGRCDSASSHFGYTPHPTLILTLPPKSLQADIREAEKNRRLPLARISALSSSDQSDDSVRVW